MSSTPSSTFVAADSEGYELLMGRWSRRLCESFLDFVGIEPGHDILDVGCGTGCMASALLSRSHFSRLLGIDFSPVYVAHAANRYIDPRVFFEVGDACGLNLPDSSFDRVLSLLVLQFIPHASQAIAEMKRVARPGAVVAAAVWDVRGGYIANRIFFDTAAALDANAVERRARNYTRPLTRPGELANAWRAAGFHHLKEETLGIRMEFSCFQDYWAPYEGKDGPGAEYVATLSDNVRANLREAVRRAYLDGDADGPRSYAALAWAVRGIAPA
jgi:SAM-dependent methyltransferase